MDFPFNQQKMRPTRQISGWTAAMLLSLLTVVVSGCTSQEAKLSNANPALLTEPVVDTTLNEQDFGFPSQSPSLKRGKEIFDQQCVKCHVSGYWQSSKVKQDLAYTTPIDLYLMLSSGKAEPVLMPTAQRKQVLPANHISIRENVGRDDRWAVIFYARYLAGAGDIQAPGGGGRDAMQSKVFGGNCAVCHGNRGQADGPLHIGRTGNHELHDGQLRNDLVPAPANFTQYSRMYNRTDAQIFKYICQGIYPSAMPSWYGNVERDKDTGKVVYVFDDKLIWNLVRHVRAFTYNNDLPETEAVPAGLQSLQSCQPMPNNRPWTPIMSQNASAGSKAYKVPSADPVTGGMILPRRKGTPMQNSTPDDKASSTGGALGL